MSETFETLKSHVRNWLGLDERRLPDSTAGMMINMAQRELLRKHDLAFGEHEDEAAVLQGVRNVPVPGLLRQPYTIWYIDDTGNKYDLIYETKVDFDGLFPDATKQSLPGRYTWWGSILSLGHTPDRDLTLHRNYYRLLPDLVDGPPNNTNALIENAWEAVFARALTFATAFTVEDPRLPMWRQWAKEKEQELVTEFRYARSAVRPAQGRIP